MRGFGRLWCGVQLVLVVGLVLSGCNSGPTPEEIREKQREKEIEEAKALRVAEGAEGAAANQDKPKDQISVFGSTSPSQPRATNPKAERKRAEELRKEARQNSVYYFQHTLLPGWLYNYSNEIVEKGNIDELVANAREKVDEDFAESLALHRYPDKNIYILEFEKPNNVSECFFFAIKTRESGDSCFYALEKGISIFGVGEVSALFEWRSRGNVSKLGGRDYEDLSSFLQELETIRPVGSRNE